MEYLGKTDFVHVKPALDELAINFRQALIEAQNEARQAGAPQGQLDLPLEKAVVPRAGDGDDAGEIARANREAVTEGEGKYTKFTAADPLNAQLSKMMGDAPMCSTCGHVTVRNGSCYRCLNCGNSMGCS
jgi:ribonucleoside-diphosphate reductase alpha chain